jgi:hypothetical protein
MPAMGYRAVLFRRSLPTFQKFLLPPSLDSSDDGGSKFFEISQTVIIFLKSISQFIFVMDSRSWGWN